MANIDLDLDDVLRPYAGMKTGVMYIETPIIERIPNMALGQNINPRFQEFYDNLLDGIRSYLRGEGIEKLYILSDMFLEIDEFKSLFEKSFGKVLRAVEDCRLGGAYDIEVNIQKFQEPQRNILNSFNVSSYRVQRSEADDISGETKTTLFISCGEIFFTYKRGKFVIVSHFNPMIESAIEK